MKSAIGIPAALVSGLLVLGAATAQPLEDVTLEYQSSGIVATIRTTSPVRYINHFPANGGQTLEIFYECAQPTYSKEELAKRTAQGELPDILCGPAPGEKWRDNEVRKSPPSSLIPAFTVTTRDQAVKPKLVIEFVREAQYSVSQGKDQRSLQIVIKPDRQDAAPLPLPELPTVKPLATFPAGVELSPADANAQASNQQGFALMTQAREALAAKNYADAVAALNKLLMLPLNDYTQDGQEWVGVARERGGEIDKAKAEYDLYLNLFPQSEGAQRVMQRLAALAGKQSDQGIVDESGKKQAERWMMFGGLGTRYHSGKSNIESTTTWNNVTDVQKLSLVDTKMLITNADMTGRYVSEEMDGRVVFRGTNSKSLIDRMQTENRLSSMYGEIKGRTQDYMVRVGRQSASGGGVPGRFDGLSASYGNVQEFRSNIATGVLADRYSGTKPTFVGASVDSTLLVQDYNLGEGSLYGINQRVDGVTDRRGVGAEWRYFRNNLALNGLMDVDVYFKSLNATQLMGSWGADGMRINWMLDRRKTPSLSIRNALNGATVSSVDALLQTMSESALRQLAIKRTSTTSMAQVGMTMPVSEKWQMGGDVRVSQTASLAASGNAAKPQGFLAAIPSRGIEKSYTAQAIGSNLFQQGDIVSLSATRNASRLVNGTTLFAYHHTTLKSGWSLDSSLQFSKQSDQFNTTTTRMSPMVRGAYQVRDRLFFDADFGLENTKLTGGKVNTAISRIFGSAGMRWDF